MAVGLWSYKSHADHDTERNIASPVLLREQPDLPLTRGPLATLACGESAAQAGPGGPKCRAVYTSGMEVLFRHKRTTQMSNASPSRRNVLDIYDEG